MPNRSGRPERDGKIKLISRWMNTLEVWICLRVELKNSMGSPTSSGPGSRGQYK